MLDDAANKELEVFAYSVSHDLRAPLRAISGFTAILTRRHQASLNDEGRHYLDNIAQAGERMAQLIDDLLAYSRLGRASARREPVDLGDRTLLTQIFSNLLDNALNYRQADVPAEMLGGQLWVESEVGQGSTFFIKLAKE